MDAERRLVENPFLVLALPADAPRLDVEREAQKLLGMLELGFASVAEYATPLGPRRRTSDLVRAAVAALRDPERRLVAEVWARGMEPATDSVTASATDSVTASATDSATASTTDSVTASDPDTDADAASDTRWPGALQELGWTRGS